jgi:integrase/recombinase XerD
LANFIKQIGKLFLKKNKLNLVDTKTDGLKKDTNTGIYYIYKTIPGRGRIRKSLKTTEYHVAKFILDEIYTSGAKDLKNKVIIPLKDAIDQYIIDCENIKKLKALTIEFKERKLNSFLSFSGNVDLGKVNNSIVKDYINYRSTSVGKNTLNGDIKEIKALMNWATTYPEHDNAYLTHNPIKVSKYKVERKPRKSLSSRNIKLFLEYLKSEDYRFYQFCIVMLFHGLRMGELLTLSFSDIDSTKWQIDIKKTKTNEPRSIPIPEKIKPIVQKLQHHPESFKINKRRIFNENDLLFPDFWKDRVEYYFSKYRLQLNIDQHITPHTLRHTYATLLKESGVNTGKIQELLGHSSEKTTEIYLNVGVDSLRDSVEKIDISI